jgi:type I restriction enzyme S subunit
MGDSKDAIKGKTLNSKSLNSLLIPLPPLKEQRHIIKRLEELYARL